MPSVNEAIRQVRRLPKRLLRTVRYLLWHTGLAVPLLAILSKLWPAQRQEPDLDVLFVTPRSSEGGWILEAICREVGQRLGGLKIGYWPTDQPLPPARMYFFSHYMFYFQHLSLARMLRNRPSYVFATHLEPTKHGLSNRAVAKLLGYSEGVICMNRQLEREFGRLGVPPEKLHVAIGGSDPCLHLPHARAASGSVGFCSAYYPRKSPELMVNIVRRMPWRNFLLIGKGWSAYSGFKEFLKLPNFRYVEPEYRDYPRYYSEMTVFVSPSQLEGGPIPLLESMMSNAVPVASRTGFAPDVISHGTNGFLFDVPGDAASICEMIDRAFELDCDVSRTVQQYSWDCFAYRICSIMGLGSLGGYFPNGTSNCGAQQSGEASGYG